MDSVVLMGAAMGGLLYRRRRRRRLWLTFAPEAWLQRTQQRVWALQAALQALRPALLDADPERRGAVCAATERHIDALITAQQREQRHLPPAGRQYSESIDQLMVAYLWRVYALRDGDAALRTVTERQIAALGHEALAAQMALLEDAEQSSAATARRAKNAARLASSSRWR